MRPQHTKFRISPTAVTPRLKSGRHCASTDLSLTRARNHSFMVSVLSGWVQRSRAGSLRCFSFPSERGPEPTTGALKPRNDPKAKEPNTGGLKLLIGALTNRRRTETTHSLLEQRRGSPKPRIGQQKSASPKLNCKNSSLRPALGALEPASAASTTARSALSALRWQTLGSKLPNEKFCCGRLHRRPLRRYRRESAVNCPSL